MDPSPHRHKHKLKRMLTSQHMQGVHSHRLRWLSVFIAATLLLTILALLWTSSVLHFASLLLDVFLVLVSVQHRSSLMGSWFTASR